MDSAPTEPRGAGAEGGNLSAEPVSEQLDIFRSPPPPPLPDPGQNRVGAWHAPESSAPATEREAAILVYPRTGTTRLRVLAFLVSRGAMGATDEEIAEALEMRLYTAAPRRNELKRDGWVEDSGRRRPTTTGTQAAVWRVTARGLSEYQAP